MMIFAVSMGASLPDQLEQILNEPVVDAAIDCVGFEARGHGHGAGELTVGGGASGKW